MSWMKGLRDSAASAMKGRLGRLMGRANGGSVAAPKGTKGFAAGGAVDVSMGDVGGAPASTNLGRSARGRPKGSKNKSKGKKKGGTNVNVVVMPKPDAAPAAPPIIPIPPPPVIAGPPPPMPGPMGPPPGGPPPGLMGLGGPPPPDAMGMGGPPPPMPMRADGGKVDLPKGQDEGGAGSGVGRLEKAKDYGSTPGKAISA